MKFKIDEHFYFLLFLGIYHLFFAYVVSSKVSGFQRVLLTVCLLGIGMLILPSVLEFAKVEETSIESFSEFATEKASNLSRSNTGSRLDISSYPFPLKVFTFLFRPLFFDINGIPALIASFENILLLIFTFKVLKNKPLLVFKEAPFVLKGLVLFLIIGTFVFSQSLGNMGVMIRMRNMFLPGLLLFFLWPFSYNSNKNIIQN